MLDDIFVSDRPFLESENGILWDAESGLTPEKLRIGCRNILCNAASEPYIITKAKLIAYLFENAQVEVNPRQYFSVRINHGDIMAEIKNARLQKIQEGQMQAVLAKYADAVEAFAFTGDCDFSHTVPDWDAILQLGLTGLHERIQKCLMVPGLTEGQRDFYTACDIVYSAWKVLLRRMADVLSAQKKGSEKIKLLAETMMRLTHGAPSTTFEAMILMAMFYNIQTYVDGINLRSLGRLDKLLWPFYLNDLESGRYTKAEIRCFIQYFYFHFYNVGAIANTPFCLCGSDESSEEITNELTYLLLDVYGEMDIHDPKIHIRCGKHLPDEILDKTTRMIRAGQNSILYINDEIVFKSMGKIGIRDEHLANYVPVGCYEPTATGLEVACSCAGRVNILKAVESAMCGGVDNLSGKQIGLHTKTVFDSFKDFYNTVKQQLAYYIDGSMELIREYEKQYMQISPGPIFSATLLDCVEQGKDAYAGGARYNNSSICAFATANAVDSLIAIKHAVFDEKCMSLSQLRTVLSENWAGHEKLRQMFIRSYPKYGNNNPEADEITMDLIGFVADYINNKPNARGGVFRCGLFSIDWRGFFGEAMAATADGRFCGEALSKNMSALVGRDKEGVTSLINSVTKIDYTKIPNGTVLDIALHHSAVAGADGLQALKSLLKIYLKKGGIAAQVNVLNPAILLEAQKNPEKYATLQVRLCGWNVYFVELDKFEQDYFIQQAMEA